ncbi:MAG: 2-halobenzoate 1,2-dioxygenase small subunit [Alphaproteobacteria bacterium MarineAlpha11_Bin1]|nr:MAG: 2-halobenzoate 1,2-dioxygenase small subunit [Alphaproteobacteria bacterium MarineAlpha11_Bin1]|tara:strand:- start:8815 stop:9297 length:483 start_codon:yes stop_codon:yes gene_type:complete
MNNDAALVRNIEVFIFREAYLLDERRFEEWMSLFALDGIYWIPATPGQTDPLGEVSIAYEDLQLIDVRVRRLGHPENYADQPTVRTRRIIGNLMIDQVGEESIIARSNFSLADLQGDDQRMFFGEYVHTLRPINDGYEIVQKRVNLLNCDAPLGGIVVPF